MNVSKENVTLSGVNSCILSSAETGIATSPHMYGDLLLTPEQEKLLNIDEGGVAQGFLNGIRFWPNSIVPYELDFRLSK